MTAKLMTSLVADRLPALLIFKVLPVSLKLKASYVSIGFLSILEQFARAGPQTNILYRTPTLCVNAGVRKQAYVR